MRARFVGRVDASGIIYDDQRQYVSQITIGPLLSAIKNTSSTFIRQINLGPMECGPAVPSRFIDGRLSSLSSLIHSRVTAAGNKWPRGVNHLAEN